SNRAESPITAKRSRKDEPTRAVRRQSQRSQWTFVSVIGSPTRAAHGKSWAHPASSAEEKRLRSGSSASTSPECYESSGGRYTAESPLYEKRGSGLRSVGDEQVAVTSKPTRCWSAVIAPARSHQVSSGLR